MDQRDLLNRLLLLLDDEEFKTILQQAIKKGFRVDGFETGKKLSSMPRKFIINNMARDNRRALTNEKYFFSALQESDIEEVQDLIKKWEQDKNAVQEMLEFMEKKKLEETNIYKDKKDKDNEETERKKENENKNDQIIEELKETVEQLREQNKKYKKTLQSNRIAIDNNKKAIASLEKERDDIKKQLKKKSETVEKLSLLNGELKNEGEQSRKTIQFLQEKIDKLVKIKDQMPRILIFAKQEIDQELLDNNNAIPIHEWDDELTCNIEWNKYGKIFIVTNDFPYSVQLDIKKYLRNGQELKKFSTMKRLVAELED